jgi:site-specific DNA-cytosine methylase
MGFTILDLCSGSGNWSQPYLEAGYDVVRVELKDGMDARLWPTEISATARLPEFFDDIRPWIGKVHGVLAAPVCTVFSASGARWPRTDEEILDGLSLVDACLRLVHVLQPNWWALENPIGKINRWIGDPYYTFNPNHFGDPYTKKTHLWGRFTKPRPTFDTLVEPTEGSRMHFISPSEERKAIRSATPMGFSRAFKEANP